MSQKLKLNKKFTDSEPFIKKEIDEGSTKKKKKPGEDLLKNKKKLDDYITKVIGFYKNYIKEIEKLMKLNERKIEILEEAKNGNNVDEEIYSKENYVKLFIANFISKDSREVKVETKTPKIMRWFEDGFKKI